MLSTQARQCMLGCNNTELQKRLPRSCGAFHAAAKAATPCAMITRYHSTQARRRGASQKPGCTCSRMGQHSSARPDGARWRAIAAARPATWRRSYATSLPMMTCMRRGARAGEPRQPVAVDAGLDVPTADCCRGAIEARCKAAWGSPPHLQAACSIHTSGGVADVSGLRHPPRTVRPPPGRAGRRSRPWLRRPHRTRPLQRRLRAPHRCPAATAAERRPASRRRHPSPGA